MNKKQLKDDVIDFKSLDEFKEIKNNYQNNQKIKFNCQKCEKVVIRLVERINLAFSARIVKERQHL